MEYSPPEFVRCTELLDLVVVPVVARLRPFNINERRTQTKGKLGELNESSPELPEQSNVLRDLPSRALREPVETVPRTPARAGDRGPQHELPGVLGLRVAHLLLGIFQAGGRSQVVLQGQTNPVALRIETRRSAQPAGVATTHFDQSTISALRVDVAFSGAVFDVKV